MIEIGVFAKTYARPTLGATLDAVMADGIRHIQFNFQSAGLESMPGRIDSAMLSKIATDMKSRKIRVDAVSGTFNMIHPDSALRTDGLERLEAVADCARELDTSLITVCTGTRDTSNMWGWHPENDTESAWIDLLASMAQAVDIADRHDIYIGIEPEPGNVVSCASKARKLLDSFDSDRLKIIYDPANVVEGVPLSEHSWVLDEAFSLLGGNIISVHGKDRNSDGHVVPVGKGIVPWDHVISRLRFLGYCGSVHLHGLDETDVPAAREFLQGVIAGK